jgi:hypothetical protein
VFTALIRYIMTAIAAEVRARQAATEAAAVDAEVRAVKDACNRDKNHD